MWYNMNMINNYSSLFKIVFFILLTINTYASTATIFWDSPKNNLDGSLISLPVSYKVYYGTDNCTNQIKVRSETYAIVDGLIQGQTYNFSITSTSNTGVESPLSKPITYTPSINSQLVPLILNIDMSSSDNVNLSWNHVAQKQLTLQRTFNLSSPFIDIVSNLTSVTNISMPLLTNSSVFYRLIYSVD